MRFNFKLRTAVLWNNLLLFDDNCVGVSTIHNIIICVSKFGGIAT